MRTRAQFNYSSLCNRVGIRPDFCIFPILPIGSVTCIHGPSAVGKTTLIAELACRVMSGQHNDMLKTENSGGVYVVSPEDPASFRAPLEGTKAKFGLESELLDRRLTAIPPDDCESWMQPTDKDFVSKMTDEIRHFNSEVGTDDQIKLLIFDSLFLGIDEDEGQNKEVKKMMRKIGALARNVGAAVIVIAHSIKSSSKVMGGSGHWTNAASGVYLLDKQKNGRRTLTVEKSRFQHCAPFYGLMYDYEKNGGIPFIHNFRKYEAPKRESKYAHVVKDFKDKTVITHKDLVSAGEKLGLDMTKKQWYRPMVEALEADGMEAINPKTIRDGMHRPEVG